MRSWPPPRGSAGNTTYLTDPRRAPSDRGSPSSPSESEGPRRDSPSETATLPHPFRVLREAGLVKQVNRGNSRMAQLRRADLDVRFPGLLGLLDAEAEAAQETT